MTSESTPLPLVIGRKEYLDFPEWGIRRIRVKVDTGARTSALDALEYEVCNGGKTLRMRLALHRRWPERVQVVETPLLRTVMVCNTGGCREQRPVIEALVKLGPVTKRILLNITNRSTMRHCMILGREALAGTFLVDASKNFILTRRKET